MATRTAPADIGAACLIQLGPPAGPPSFQVINVEESFANLLPSKVEIALKKDSPITWARLEHLQSRGVALQPPPPDATTGSFPEGQEGPSDESDDSLSWSEEEGED